MAWEAQPTARALNGGAQRQLRMLRLTQSHVVVRLSSALGMVFSMSQQTQQPWRGRATCKERMGSPFPTSPPLRAHREVTH